MSNPVFSDEVYYQLAYYICDGFIGITCIICLSLNVTMERSGDKVSPIHYT